MPVHLEKVDQKPHRFVNLSRLEALGDAIFAFALTLLALDIRLPEIAPRSLSSRRPGPSPETAYICARFPGDCSRMGCAPTDHAAYPSRRWDFRLVISPVAHVCGPDARLSGYFGKVSSPAPGAGIFRYQYCLAVPGLFGHEAVCVAFRSSARAGFRSLYSQNDCQPVALSSDRHRPHHIVGLSKRLPGLCNLGVAAGHFLFL
jgi:hypothetical protein